MCIRDRSQPVQNAINLDPSQINSIDDATYQSIPKGQDYFPEGSFVMNRQSKEISYYGNGIRQVVSTPIAAKLGVSAANSIPLSVAQYAGIPQGNDYVPDGAFLQDNFTGQIGQYSNGIFHLVSQAVAGVMGLTQSQIIHISHDQYSELMKPSEYYPDGIFLQNVNTGEVSQYSGGQRHVLSQAVLAAVKPSQANMVVETVPNYAAIPRGNDYFPEGMIIKDKKTSDVSIYLGGQRHAISPQVAQAMNLTSTQIVSISDAQYMSISQGTDYTPST